MAWDTEATKKRLLDAAVEEFAEYGPAGGRVDRIAKNAGVNKERIYQYFGDKAGLFRAVLDTELLKLAAANPLTAEAAKDLGAYAGRAFDYHVEHPHYLRLLRWEGLLPDAAAGLSSSLSAERRDHYREKVGALVTAQESAELPDEIDAGALMYAVIALAGWWTVNQALGSMLLETDDLATRRAVTVDLVRRLVAV